MMGVRLLVGVLAGLLLAECSWAHRFAPSLLKVTELADGRQFVLTPGVSYQVADEAEPHRSYTPTGAKLFIVD